MPVTKLDPKTALLAMCAAGAVKLEPIDISATGDTGTEEVQSLVSINVSRLEAVLAGLIRSAPATKMFSMKLFRALHVMTNKTFSFFFGGI